MTAGNITYTVDNHVATVFFETESHNSLTLENLKTLADYFNKASEDKSVKIVLLKSGGKTFCAGANFNQLLSIENFEAGKSFFMGFGNLILAIKKCDKIVVGRIHGKAIGGGVGLAAACDFTVASEFATIRLSELNIGLGPLVIGPMVERKLGLSGLSALSLNPKEWKTAYWAQQKGLFNEVFQTQIQADAYLATYLESMKNTSLQAMTIVKKMLWENTENWDELLESRAEQSAKLLLTRECKSEIAKFLGT
jgi:methylglutaconyl-CoA hydratase